jgi:hypothetical protein
VKAYTNLDCFGGMIVTLGFTLVMSWLLSPRDKPLRITFMVLDIPFSRPPTTTPELPFNPRLNNKLGPMTIGYPGKLRLDEILGCW